MKVTALKDVTILGIVDRPTPVRMGGGTAMKPEAATAWIFLRKKKCYEGIVYGIKPGDAPTERTRNSLGHEVVQVVLNHQTPKGTTFFGLLEVG